MIEYTSLKVFYSYSHKDEHYRENLEKHLSNLIRQKRIETWCDLRIIPGTNWKSQIADRIETSDIILFLVSADFLASDYCYSEEMERAIKRDKDGEARVIPIYVRPVYKEELPFEKLQSLPFDARPVESWASHDEAWVSVVKGIWQVIEEINNKRELKSRKPRFNSDLKQDFTNFSDKKALAINSRGKTVFQENQHGKTTYTLKVTEANIDARAQRLKSIARSRDISREEANAAIEETEEWLREHENDTNIRQIYLSLIEKQGTSEQVQKAIKLIKLWLDKNRTNTNVRAQYIKLITKRTSVEKLILPIEEAENWIRWNKKDESVLMEYLRMVEKWNKNERILQAIKNIEEWCPTSSQSNRLKDKLSKLRKTIEKVERGKYHQSTISQPLGSFEIALLDSNTFAHELSRLAKEGALEECKAAIEETRYWLDKHYEDTNIRQVYLKLVGKEGIDDKQVKKSFRGNRKLAF